MLLEANGIQKSYDGVKALTSVSLELRAGEVHALVGENGAGKSTLIKVLTGAVQPDGGEVRLHDQRIEHNNPAKAHELGISAIYQQPALFPDLSVAENIAIGNDGNKLWRRVDWRTRTEQATRLLQQIGARISPGALVSSLSMPEQQLVEIAKALAANASVLIMDEPTSSLGQKDTRNLLRIVRELRARGTGILYISHRLEELFEIADRVTVLRDGNNAGTHEMAGVTSRQLIRMMVGRELETLYPKLEIKPGEVALELRSVCCKQSSVKNVNLAIRSGEIVGLAGLVGSGRTQLADALFGLATISQGSVYIDGMPAEIRSPRDAVQAGLAYVPEDRRRHAVILEMAIRSNVTLASLDKLSKNGMLQKRAERDVAQEFTERLRVKATSIETLAKNLSGGNQQKVALARWLVTKPRVLILDEPTQGIDVHAKSEIYHLIGALAETGMAILLISSEMSEILALSDRIAVMSKGELVGIFDREDASPDEILRLALGQNDGGFRGAELKLQLRRAWPALIALGALYIYLAFAAPKFYSANNLRDLALANVAVLLVATGMTLVIVLGEIDISVGAVFAVCSIICGAFAKVGMPPILWPLVAVAAGGILGATNGTLVSFVKAPSIVVTLATMVAWREALRWITNGAWIEGLPNTFQWFGLGQRTGEAVIVLSALLLFGIPWWASRNLAAVRAIYATGSDAEAARLAGLPTNQVVLWVFVLMGVLTGIAALLNAVRFSDVPANSGINLELKAIAAVVVGGTPITGGRGDLVGTLIGVMLLGSIGPALIFLGVSPYWEKAIQGAIILTAVLVDAIGSWRGRRMEFA